MDHFVIELKENALLYSVCLFVFLLFPSIPIYLRILLIGLYAFYRTRNVHTWILVALMCCCGLPRTSMSIPECKEGRITKIRSGYMVVEQEDVKLLLYVEDPLQFDLDATVCFEGELKAIETTPGFFRYDFQDQCRRNGIYYAMSCTRIECLRETQSLRGKLMHRAKEKEHATEYLSALFGFRSTNSMFSRFLAESGISVSCVLSFFELVFKRLLTERKRRRALLILCLGLCVFEHFSFAVSAQLVYRSAGLCLKERKERIGCSMLILLVAFPACVLSPAFLIPYAFRFFSLFGNLGKLACLRISWILQSIVFHSFNPFFSLFYRALMPIYGFYWIFTLAEVLGFGSVLFLGKWIDMLLKLLSVAEQRGSVLGVGGVLYILLYRACIGSVHREFVRTGLFLLFFIFGWYHPLGEVMLLNVGQGDCILLRAPFNTCNILIDTGKQSASAAVKDVIEGLGIRKIETIYISHSDEDHRGGLESILEYCTVNKIVEDHFDVSVSGPFTFYDLNDVKNEDPNASSQVLYTSLNGLTYLFTGDLDARGEEKLLRIQNRLTADVLKVAHHGSSTSSSRAFLGLIRPSLALISCGLYDLYHHPSPSVIQTLLSLHVPYFKTIEDGDLRILQMPLFNIFFTSSGKIAIIRSYDRGS